jgi:hypothetical protein
MQDTIPRYSSAKYLSRLCVSLPPSFASQIVDAVLSNLEEALSEANEQGLADRAEGKVQGACLACGEMARRGLLGKGEDAEEQIRRVVDGVLQVRFPLLPPSPLVRTAEPLSLRLSLSTTSTSPAPSVPQLAIPPPTSSGPFLALFLHHSHDHTRRG